MCWQRTRLNFGHISSLWASEEQNWRWQCLKMALTAWLQMWQCASCHVHGNLEKKGWEEEKTGEKNSQRSRARIDEDNDGEWWRWGSKWWKRQRNLTYLPVLTGGDVILSRSLICFYILYWNLRESRHRRQKSAGRFCRNKGTCGLNLSRRVSKKRASLVKWIFIRMKWVYYELMPAANASFFRIPD